MFGLRQFHKLRHAPKSLLSRVQPQPLSSFKILHFPEQKLHAEPSQMICGLPSSFRSFATTSRTVEELMEKIDKCVKSGDVVVFMKGVPEAPRCGFSNAVCQIFRMHEVKITSYDVLEDEELRQGVKEFSKWPTFPQVFFHGELIGGCDILLQMHQSGELIEELEKIGIKSALAGDEPTDKK